MSVAALARLVRSSEEIVDRCNVDALESAMPTGGRPRQLSVRTLFVGMLVNARRFAPMYLKSIHQTLLSLDAADRCRLGVDLVRPDGTLKTLTYRQVEYTFNVVIRLMNASPAPSFRGVPEPEQSAHLGAAQLPPERADAAERLLNAVCDGVLEATIPDQYKTVTGVAVDWTDADSWARGRGSRTVSPDPNAAWGRRRSQQPGLKDAVYYGYGETVATIVRDERGSPLPNLVRRMDLEAANEDHAWQAVDIARRMLADGLPPGDLLGDSAYSHRRDLTRTVTELGYAPIFDLHPTDTGPKGTHEGAVIANECLYCPATPERLLQIRKPKNGASKAEVDAHDQAIATRDAYRFTRHTSRDEDGYVRLACPAVTGKVRCPIRETMHLDFTRPEILDPPSEPSPCCTQKTITVPPSVADKTRQKHVFASAAWRSSYRRRTAVERSFGAIKDSSCEDASRGRIRLMGRAKTRLMRTFMYASVNMRLLDAFEQRQASPPSAAPRTRRKRRPQNPVTSQAA